MFTLIMLFISFLGIYFINIHIIKSSQGFIYSDVKRLPEKTAVLVLGAQVYEGELSVVLEDRVNAGVDIYLAGKVKKIILSGHHGKQNYDEVNTMRKYILTKFPQISQQDIFMDHAGFDTYDSVYRAKEIFEANNLIIVTQNFHISRAVFLARNLGVDAVGFSVSEDKYNIVLRNQWKVREYLARVKAFFNILLGAKPTYGGEKIPVFGDGRKSWD